MLSDFLTPYTVCIPIHYVQFSASWPNDEDEIIVIDHITAKSESEEETSGFEWNVTTGGSTLNETQVYFLSLGPTDAVNNGKAATSHYFNITDNAVASQGPVTSATTSAAQSTSTQTTSTLAEAIPNGSAQPTSSTTATSDPTSHPSKSNNSALAIGLGVGLSIPLLLLVISFVGLKSYQLGKSNPSIWPWSARNQEIPAQVQSQAAAFGGVLGYHDVTESPVELGTAMNGIELPTTYNVTELPAGIRQPVELASGKRNAFWK